MCKERRLADDSSLANLRVDQDCATVCMVHEVMRATNSWAMNWADESDGQKLDGRLVMGHQLGE